MNSLKKKSQHYEDIKKSIEYFEEHYAYQPKLEEVAFHVGMSKHHFSRLFKTYAGVTPMQFLQATTLSHAKEKLLNSQSILDTAQDMGLSSSSRLHELFVNFEGVTPQEYKKMGENLTVTYGFGYSPFGKTMVASTSKGICALEFYDNRYDDILKRLLQTWQKANFEHNDKHAQMVLESIFVHKNKVSLFVKCTNFQMNVWKAILNIKNKHISTYSDIAQLIGKPKAVRAVATAIGSNHIGFLIPCHRVISKSAALAGYKWGIHRKKAILAYEENTE